MSNKAQWPDEAWYNKPIKVLGGDTPKEHSETVEGFLEVMTLVLTIQYGNFI